METQETAAERPEALPRLRLQDDGGGGEGEAQAGGGGGGGGWGSRGVYLITGGAGYIGSHCALQFLRAGEDVVVVDNLCNSSPESLARVERLSGKKVPFHRVDVTDGGALDAVFGAYPVRGVVHFAGLKSVGHSVSQPLRYYRENVAGACALLEVMERRGVRRLVFSSSATVYGQPDSVPIPETAPLRCTNPYGRTKLFVEEIVRDLCASDPRWSAVLLRYFNPCGSDESGLIGEDPAAEPTNLMPYVCGVAAGSLKTLRVFGGDYPTPDGTGVRDFIHVVDLAEGHLRAIRKTERWRGCEVYNLGRGKGYSVMEMVAEFELVSGRKIPYEVVADPSKAARELGWKAERGIREMCADMWRWQRSNPRGYSGPLLPFRSSPIF
ncbi:MAG: UDP-glucose 4-epimerase, partial [Olpidium bornovanus]